MEPSKLKTEVTASDFHQESQSINSKIRLVNIIELATQALTVLALVAGAAILGLSADALKIYNETHVGPEYFLPLWPENVDLRGNVSLVACSAIVVVISLLTLVSSKVSMVRNNPLLSTATSLTLPLLALITIIIPVALAYTGTSSPDTHSIQSWTCRWRRVPMETRPYWGTMCAQGEVGLGLATMLIPLEIVVLGVAVSGMFVRSKVGGMVESHGGSRASPALS